MKPLALAGLVVLLVNLVTNANEPAAPRKAASAETQKPDDQMKSSRRPIAEQYAQIRAEYEAELAHYRQAATKAATPGDKRGRVLAVENVFIGASNELGAFESGVTGQLLGTSGSVVLGGVATLMVAGSWWFVFPSLRTVDTFPEG